MVYGVAMDTGRDDIAHLVRDKYAGNADADLSEDLSRLASGEPLAYVIGWVPFLGVRVYLDSLPLIPRPETEWWTELLVRRIGDAQVTFLDLCAGSGAVGLAVLKHCPNAIVAFGELSKEHCALIEKNIEANGLDASRAAVRQGDLFQPFPGIRFSIVAANPPYIPSSRMLEESVSKYEPADALFSGQEGLDIILRIAKNASHHISGELWLEADVSNVAAARALLTEHGATRADIRTDLYGRERLVLAYY